MGDAYVSRSRSSLIKMINETCHIINESKESLDARDKMRILAHNCWWFRSRSTISKFIMRYKSESTNYFKGIQASASKRNINLCKNETLLVYFYWIQVKNKGFLRARSSCSRRFYIFVFLFSIFLQFASFNTFSHYFTKFLEHPCREKNLKSEFDTT